MLKNIQTFVREARKRGDSEEMAAWEILPTTFKLPADWGLFVEAFRSTAGTTWLMKPVGSAQGKGIFLFHKLAEVAAWRKAANWSPDAPQAEPYVVQRYIESPYLIGGRKFDCRVYILVTSYRPLTVWAYRSAFARFALVPFQAATAANADDLYMHLTNSSIQKKRAEYGAAQGLKWSMRALKSFLTSKHGAPAVEAAFDAMLDAILRSLQAVHRVMIADSHCFELYGYDILFDSDLKPWLIEVNASPSMSATSADDYKLKYAVASDLLDVLDLEGARSGSETQVGGFDLVWQGHRILPAAERAALADRAGGAAVPSPYVGPRCPIGLHNPSVAKYADVPVPAKFQPGSASVAGTAAAASPRDEVAGHPELCLSSPALDAAAAGAMTPAPVPRP